MELDGTGAPDDPYRVESADDLAKVDDPDGHYEQVADINVVNSEQQLAEDSYFDDITSSNIVELIASLAVASLAVALIGILLFSSWLPSVVIAVSCILLALWVLGLWNPESASIFDEFSGVYQGNGHTVSGLTTPLVSTVADGATVQNLHIKGADISTRADELGAIGQINNGEVTNVTVSDSTLSGASTCGGLVGVNESGQIHSATVQRVAITDAETAGGSVGINHGQIQTVYTADSEVAGEDTAGGLVGENSDGHVSSALVENVTVTYGNNVGGALGVSEHGGVEGISVNCSTIQPDGTYSDTSGAGGFIGYNKSKSIIRNCAAVESSVEPDEDVKSGGFAGINGNAPKQHSPQQRSDYTLSDYVYKDDGVILESFAAVTGAESYFAGRCAHFILNSFAERDSNAEEGAIKSTPWLIPIVSKKRDLTGDRIADTLDGFFVTGSDAYPEPASVVAVRRYRPEPADLYDHVTFTFDTEQARREDLTKRYAELVDGVESLMATTRTDISSSSSNSRTTSSNQTNSSTRAKTAARVQHTDNSEGESSTTDETGGGLFSAASPANATCERCGEDGAGQTLWTCEDCGDTICSGCSGVLTPPGPECQSCGGQTSM